MFTTSILSFSSWLENEKYSCELTRFLLLVSSNELADYGSPVLLCSPIMSFIVLSLGLFTKMHILTYDDI
jgi:hypothetical protein